MATLLKLIPPAATKAVIDYVILAHPLPAGVAAWSPVSLPESPKARLVALVSLVLVVSVLGKLFGLSSRWQATRVTKRVQVAVRRKVYEHAMRLPLHRVYQLKSGGASSLLREDAGGVGELIFSMLYNPWQAVVQFLGGVVVLAWVDWRLLLGALLLGAGRLLLRPALEPPHPPLVPRRPQRAPGDRQPDDRGLRRHARGAGLRPAKERVGAVHGPKPLHGTARAPRLVAFAVDRAALGIHPAHGLGRALALRRHAGHRRPALAGRPDDVPGLPGDAAGADGRAGHERHPVPEQPLRLRPRARPAGRAARDGRLPRHPRRLQERGRRCESHSRTSASSIPGPAARCCTTSTWRSSPARRSRWWAGADRARPRSAT